MIVVDDDVFVYLAPPCDFIVVGASEICLKFDLFKIGNFYSRLF